MRSASGDEPSFSLFSDSDAISVTGMLDASSVEQFRRILSTLPVDRPLVLDLTGATFLDPDGLLVLAESANADRPLRVRDNGHLRELVSQIGLVTPHLRFEPNAAAPTRCTRCGDVIGVYEPAVIVLDGAPHLTSSAAEPDAVDQARVRYHRACYVDGSEVVRPLPAPELRASPRARAAHRRGW